MRLQELGRNGKGGGCRKRDGERMRRRFGETGIILLLWYSSVCHLLLLLWEHLGFVYIISPAGWWWRSGSRRWQIVHNVEQRNVGDGWCGGSGWLLMLPPSPATSCPSSGDWRIGTLASVQTGCNKLAFLCNKRTPNCTGLCWLCFWKKPQWCCTCISFSPCSGCYIASRTSVHHKR